MLTDAKLRTLKYKPLASEGEKNKGQLLGNRIPDKDGMYIHVAPTGTISFRYDFRWPRSAKGKRQCITYGRYPIKTLEEARDNHIDALRKMRGGINPLDERRQKKRAAIVAVENTFKAVGDRWYEKNKKGKSASWLEANRRYLDAAYPHIGHRPLAEIAAPEIKAIVRAVESSGRAVTAEKMRQTYMMVFDFAADKEDLIQNGVNPARFSVDVPDSKPHPHLKAHEIPEFVKAIDGATETGERTRIAAKLVMLCITRKLELIGAKWSELDFVNASWEIPAARMKGGKPHVVPLSRQALEHFKRLREIANGSECEFVFPNIRDRKKPMGETTLNRLLERLQYTDRVTIHGLRGTASTILNGLGYKSDWIEKQLAHTETDEVRAAYNHADYMIERRRMLQDWADATDRLCAGQPLVVTADNVVQLGSAKAA
jgi:integrase